MAEVVIGSHPKSALGAFPGRFFFAQSTKEKSMFIPFLAASVIAAAFTTLGAMAVKLSVLSMALNAMIALCITLAAVAVWLAKKS